MKKIITFLLAMVMLFSIVACATESNEKKPQNNVQTKEEKIWDKKDYDFGGETFVVLGKATTGAIDGWTGDDIDCEEMTGNEVLDSVYTRNQYIEQTYNCEIILQETADVKGTLMAGSEEDGHMVVHTIKTVFGLVEDEFLLNLNDSSFTNLNLDKEWYSQAIQRDTEIAGTLYFVNGDMLFTDENAMWVTYFNKELATRYLGDVNIYDLVREGKWTVDEFMKYAALATAEVQADDKMDYHDQWGYVGEAANVAAFVAGGGYLCASITEDGGVQSNVLTEEFQEAFKKCYQTVDKSFALLASDILGTASGFTTRGEIFQEGRALFLTCGMSHAIKMREVDTDFGIIPNPKLTEEQKEYYTWTTDNTHVVAVPYTCTDPERTSAIMEALFEESSYALKSAYIDKALKYQTTRDDDSIEMLDIIIGSTIYDIGVVYNFGGVYTQLNDIVRTRTIGAMSSTLKKIEVKAIADINDLLAKLGYKA